jgi:hypothetical protein
MIEQMLPSEEEKTLISIAARGEADESPTPRPFMTAREDITDETEKQKIVRQFWRGQ